MVWFGRGLKAHPIPPLLWAGTSSSVAGCSALALDTARDPGAAQLFWAPVPGPAHPHREEFLPDIQSEPTLSFQLFPLVLPILSHYPV